MDIDSYLHRMTLLDCDGQASHTLILALDGSVEIRFRDGRTAHISVAQGENTTPWVNVPSSLLAEALAFGRTVPH